MDSETTFDFDAWLAATKKIPKGNIAEALKAVVARKNAIDLEPEIFAQRNQTATVYHAASNHEKLDGVVVWQAPIADFAAYPSGFEVLHDGKRWVNLSQDIAVGVPGVDPAWQEVVQIEEVNPGE